MISGTNGLLGAVDGEFILHKEKRTSNSAVLDILGRDQQDQKLYLNRNPETLLWELDHTETKLWKEKSEPILEAISRFVNFDNPKCTGTPTDLVHQLGVDMKANTLTLKLNINTGKLLIDYGISYESSRNHDGRRVSLSLCQSAKRDDGDVRDDVFDSGGGV